MNHHPTLPTEQVDHRLKHADPIQPSKLGRSGIENALDDLGAAIATKLADGPEARRRRSLRRPRAVVIGVAAVLSTATVAAAAGLTAHTGTFNPTLEQIANASPSDAATMQSQFDMGGPGEFLNPSAPDFHDAALQVASDIPYPAGYGYWREFLISQEIRFADGSGTESTGALHGWFAASAFCAWVQVWRQADLTGDAATAAQAADVIAAAPGWEAVTDEDPHPDASVQGDGGMTYSLFGWTLPYRDAVAAGDPGRVEQLLSTGYGDKCWTSDPDWMARLAAHPEWGTLSPDAMAERYRQFLAAERS